jgi:hypothetical protein
MTEDQLMKQQLESEHDIKPCAICECRVTWMERDEKGVCEDCQEEIYENEQENEYKKKYMKAIDFYKFINENNIEFHWHENPETKERDVLFFVNYWQIKDLSKLLTNADFGDEGIRCQMKDGYFDFWASDILYAHLIELTEIFGEDVQ